MLAAAGDEVMATVAERGREWGRAAHRGLLFAPVVDGEVLPTTGWEARHDVPLLAGHTRDERRLFTVLREVTAEELATVVEVFAPDRTRRPSPPGSTSWSCRTGCSACRRSASPSAPLAPTSTS